MCREKFPSVPRNFLKNINPLFHDLFVTKDYFLGQKSRTSRQIQSETFFFLLENITFYGRKLRNLVQVCCEFRKKPKICRRRKRLRTTAIDQSNVKELVHVDDKNNKNLLQEVLDDVNEVLETLQAIKINRKDESDHRVVDICANSS